MLRVRSLSLSGLSCCPRVRYVSVSFYSATRDGTGVHSLPARSQKRYTRTDRRAGESGALVQHIHISLVDVVQPSLPFPWLTTPICVLFAANMLMHYFYVCTVSPGFVDDPPACDPGSGWLWARKRKEQCSTVEYGAQLSTDVHVTKASVTRCKRCGILRPEVSTIRT